VSVAPDFHFSIITGRTVHRVLTADLNRVVAIIEQAYRSYGKGESVNPPSQLLKFSDKPNARIIALPASLRGGFDVSGIKWIGSYPDNIQQGVPRASAVLILNDRSTGYPFACIESSLISASRTAASAVLGAYHLNAQKRDAQSVSFVGNGVIARTIFDFFVGTGWRFDQVCLYDRVPEYASYFADHAASGGCRDVVTCSSGEEAIRSGDLVVFATTAAKPHVHDPALFSHNPIVLNISLRDLAPSIILASNNVVDDVDHCLTANTSPHLAEQETGHREFITGDVGDLLDGRITISADRPTIFSPFGMGILDIALGKYVFDEATARDDVVAVDDFFYDRKRW
jgi:2,3-diaminopropionate biosynthesis protein SbnB